MYLQCKCKCRNLKTFQSEKLQRGAEAEVCVEGHTHEFHPEDVHVWSQPDSYQVGFGPKFTKTFQIFS